VGYKSFTEQYLDSCGIFKDAVIGILAFIAKQERVRLYERTKAGIAVARSKGRQIGRPRLQTQPVEIAWLKATGTVAAGYWTRARHLRRFCASSRCRIVRKKGLS
jgi:DNA invertase Pin-like site-specific DNA recombinase